MTKPAPPSLTDRTGPCPVIWLDPREPLTRDPEPLARLQAGLGVQAATDLIGRAREDLVHRLHMIGAHHREGAFDRLTVCARLIGPLAGQLGLPDLGRAAAHVVDCAGGRDAVATAATVARLLRVGGAAAAEIGALRLAGP